MSQVETPQITRKISMGDEGHMTWIMLEAVCWSTLWQFVRLSENMRAQENG